ncbi:MAG TPA: tetratricopeptide repeat protein [Hellea balneolensis]|uniref:Tetratricopeptide repeat protein n=1 Tax=Hellea balneolensis TaxID=287478 RepID=A0A7C5R7V4_9PROT|nr:tetratricopeptide repeat protein [Hellea balneolensis]
MARAILGAHALSKTEYEKAINMLANKGDGAAFEDINALMRGWAQMGAGDSAAALATFDSLEGGKYFELIGTLQKAKIYGTTGEAEKAAKAFAKLDDIGLSAVESALAQARMALKNGDKQTALKRLNAFADKNDGAPAGPIRTLIEQIENGAERKIDLSPAENASRAITEPAFGYYGVQKQYEAAEMFLRLALMLDPANDKARLFLGSVLEDTDREDEAAMLFHAIEDTSPYGVSARLSEANLLFKAKKNDDAVKVLKRIYQKKPSKITLSSLGRAYLILEDYENALPIYQQLIETLGEDELKKNPQPRYLRGVCLERLGRWQDAVEDFEFVLKYKPDDADALNYLGYTWVDKGVNLGRAFTMIRKAVELQPNSGAIIDSLGWAHYKLGQYGQARIKLEEAAERSPTSATIIDHLGDIYWKLGRKREAKYQWRRALDLDPTPEEKANIQNKLKNGLSSVLKGK